MAVLTCHLCDRPASAPLEAEGHAFCCHGCRELWRVLGEERLRELRARPGVRWTALGDFAAGHPAAATSAAGAAETAELALDGLWCVSCAALVEHVLARAPGVLGCRVDYSVSTAEVAYDSAVIAVSDMRRIVRELGYAADERPGREGGAEADLLLRMGAGAVLALTVMMFSVVVWSGGLAALPPGLHAALAYGLWALTTPVVFWSGWPFLRGAYAGLRHGAPTMDLLVVTGSLSAYAYSVDAVLTGSRFLYFDISAMLVVFLLLGRALDAATRRRATDVTRLLASVAAKEARVLRGGEEREVPLAEVQAGETVVVRPGAKVPVDGRVVGGESALDESVLTGESRAVDKRPGDMVYAGTMNRQGRLLVEALRTAGDTVLGQTVAAVAAAQARKGPWQRLADRMVRWFVPSVLAIAVATFAYWRLGAHLPLSTSLLRAIAVLVIACPCALGVGTPLSVVAAARRAGRQGLLLRSGDALERAARVDTVLLDKTGTLTAGAVQLIDCVPADPHLLALAASAEAASEHPVGAAVVEAARARDLALHSAERFRAVPGAGVAAMVDGRRVRVGRAGPRARVPEELAAQAAAWEADGVTALHLRVDGDYRAVLAVSDWPRADAAQAVADLRRSGIDVRLVTGDAEGPAAAAARATGIERWYARQSPGDKAALTTALQAEGRHVVFVGDGVNDAAALVAAHLGIALATGADVSVEAGQVTLVRPELHGVVEALGLGRRSVGVIRQNLVWALAYNVLALPIAVVGLAQPIVAAGAMVVSSACVLGNALRLADRSPWRWAAGAAGLAAFIAVLGGFAWLSI